MFKNYGRETTLEDICSELRNKSVSELLEEQEVIWRSDDFDPNVLLAYDAVLAEKGYAQPDVDPEKELENFKEAHPQFFRSKSTENGDGAKESPTQRPKARRGMMLLRLLPAMIITLAALFIIAGAFNVPQRIMEFIDGAYSFVNASGPVVLPQSENIQYHSFQEALDAHGIVDKVAPTWVPTKFALQFVRELGTGDSAPIIAKYLAEDEAVINIIFTPGPPENTRNEGDGEEVVEPYICHEVAFQLSPNYDQYVAYWETEDYTVRINGDITVKELKAMINSIFKE